MICLHHNDLDGRCSAAIVYEANKQCAFIEMDYRSPLPEKDIAWDEEVFIVDFSLQKEGDWDRLFARTRNVVWMDHHETAIKRQTDFASCLAGIRRTDRCGAWLTWEWFNREIEPPYVVRLVDQWDRWVHNDADEVLNFIAGMKIQDQDPRSEIWEVLLDDYDVVDIQDDGKIIRAYETRDNAQIVSQFAYPVILDGYHCLACNSNRHNSQVFDSIPIADRPEIFIAYVHDGNQFTVSLYSTTVKVNDIAMKFGGGGHPGAAGFICGKLPWEKEEE